MNFSSSAVKASILMSYNYRILSFEFHILKKHLPRLYQPWMYDSTNNYYRIASSLHTHTTGLKIHILSLHNSQFHSSHLKQQKKIHGQFLHPTKQ